MASTMITGTNPEPQPVDLRSLQPPPVVPSPTDPGPVPGETPPASAPGTPDADTAPAAVETPPAASAPAEDMLDEQDMEAALEGAAPQGQKTLRKTMYWLREERRANRRMIETQQRQLESAMQAIAGFQQQQAPPASPLTTPSPVPQPATPPGRPSSADFSSHEDYIEAVADWKAEQKFVERDRQEQMRQYQQRLATEQQTQAERWQASVTAARTKHADFDAVMGRTTMQVPAAMEQALLSSEAGSELAYYLATHPEEAQPLFTLPPMAQVMALGELKARLTLTPPPTSPPPPPAQTMAQPLEPVAQNGTVQPTVPVDKMSYRDYQRYMSRRQAGGR